MTEATGDGYWICHDCGGAFSDFPPDEEACPRHRGFGRTPRHFVSWRPGVPDGDS